MARPLRIEYPGAFYHITSRGNERKEVFKTQRDREKFLSYLETATERYGAVVHAWCQMTNHYHLLLETPEGNLSQIMHHINGAYTTYFNVKRKRAGHLFQGRFKAILVEADEYASELSRYIHLNPVRAGIVEMPDAYQWSSYRCYIGLDRQPDWLRTDLINGYFAVKGVDAQSKYRTFVEDKIGKEYETPLNKVFASSILGSEEFVEAIRSKYADLLEEDDVSVPALRQMSVRPSLEEIADVVEAVFAGSAKQSRQAGLYFSHRYSGEKLREIGALFGLKESAVTAAARRFTMQLQDNQDLRELAAKVDKLLKK